MSLTLPRKDAAKSAAASHSSVRQNIAHSWLSVWEIYPILLMAGFLRLYQPTTTEFDGDQAAIFGLAREAVRFGLWPIVSNRASIGMENPPTVIYILMLPAALSANPFWAIVLVGLLNTLAVVLTYFFTSRYYGRLAGIVAALLYAAAAKPLNYSRFIWQQNMLAPFILLFMFALFWGVVERRKGWLWPALLLLGLAYQLHETATLLAIPLLVAVVLAPGTIRWRDLTFALISLLVIFSPYILWEFSSHFSDVSIVLKVAKLHAHMDLDAINLYKFFLSPYGYGSFYQLPASPTSVLRLFGPVLFWLRHILLLLVLGGLATAGLLAIWHPRAASPQITSPLAKKESVAITCPPDRVPLVSVVRMGVRGVRALQDWWTDFCATPYRCSLMLLFIWQVVPLLMLLRHSVKLYPYYLLVLMPGPFILMGIFVAQLVKWTQQQSRGRRVATLMRVVRYAMYAIAVFTITAQLVTCTATLIDAVNGNTGHGKTFNDLGSLQHALNEADQLAQQRHLDKVYITTDVSSEAAMRYLAEQMHTPTTLFDDSHCLVLPNASDGPAVLLVSPYAQLTLALLHQFATVTLIDQPARPGAPAFQLYIVIPKPMGDQIAVSKSFGDSLQLVNVQKQQLDVADSSWIVSHWKLLNTALPAPRVTYNYALRAHFSTATNNPSHSLCTFTAMRAGDQLFVAFATPNTSPPPTAVSIDGQFYTTTPYNPWFGPLHLETDHTQNSPTVVLRTPQGKDSITIQLSFSPGESHPNGISLARTL